MFWSGVSFLFSTLLVLLANFFCRCLAVFTVRVALKLIQDTSDISFRTCQHDDKENMAINRKEFFVPKLITVPLVTGTGIHGRVMVSRKGVPRVVWERQRRNSSPDDEQQVDLIPFLSVSRSLGDFWSLNPRTNQFVVSPTPDVNVYPLDPTNQKFVVVASDGLWNVMSPTDVVRLIWDYEHDNQKCHQPRDVVRAVINECLRRWKAKNLLADNIAVLIAFLSEEDNCQPSLSSLSSSSAPMMKGEVTTNGEVSVNGGAHVTTTSPNPSPETGSASEPRDNPGSPSSINTSTAIRHVSTTMSGSTLYYKETLPEGVTIEYETKIKLRHRRKENIDLRRERALTRLTHQGLL